MYTWNSVKHLMWAANAPLNVTAKTHRLTKAMKRIVCTTSAIIVLYTTGTHRHIPDVQYMDGISQFNNPGYKNSTDHYVAGFLFRKIRRDKSRLYTEWRDLSIIQNGD